MQVKKKLLDIVRDKIRFKHYSMKTEKSYAGWIKHYIFFHNKKHPIKNCTSDLNFGFIKWHRLTQYARITWTQKC